jgi:4-cresol dehydrogenase (hydroxylating)
VDPRDDVSAVERSSLSEALAAWSQLLGDSHVVADGQALSDASTTTFATRSRVRAIIRPGSRDDVQQCVRIANQFGIAIYPISTGKNWGYGSRVPVQDGVLMDLGRLNRILNFDEELAYVTIEPGVTQRQLYEFLQQNHSRLWMDATGASPDCSIVGNTLERGFGHTPLGDHCGAACGLEVVLPTGECLETGFSRFHNGETGALSRWGVGPSLDGLFSQSNFGIVTRMTVWLMPAPEYFQAFFFMCAERDGLRAIIDALRPLRLNGTLRSISHIGNDYKVMTATTQYPWQEMTDRRPFDPEDMKRVRKQLNIGAWNGSGGLYGSRRQVREARAQVRRALAGKVDRLQFVDDRLLGLISRFSTPFRLLTGWDVRRTLTLMSPVYNLMKGVPTDATLGSTYWRKKGPAPAVPDPDRDGCGLLWCSPVVPNTGTHALKATELASGVLLAHGFEPQISLSLATERSITCIISISYDRAISGDDERARRCYGALTEQLLASGYPPYRLNVGSMEYVTPEDDGYARALRSLKQALDPRGILSPGRYEPAAAPVSEPERDAVLDAVQ